MGNLHILLNALVGQLDDEQPKSERFAICSYVASQIVVSPASLSMVMQEEPPTIMISPTKSYASLTYDPQYASNNLATYQIKFDKDDVEFVAIRPTGITILGVFGYEDPSMLDKINHVLGKIGVRVSRDFAVKI